MKNKEIITNLIAELNQLESDGFQIHSNKEGVSFVKRYDEITNEFGIRILSNPDHQRFVSFNAGINFHEIENIIIPILKQTEIVGNSKNSNNSWTIGLSSEMDLTNKVKVMEASLPIEIRNESDIKRAAEKIINIYSFIIVKFFNRYKTSEDLYRSIKDKNYREIATTLNSGGVFKYFFIADKYSKVETEKKMKVWMNNIKNALENNPDEIQYKRFVEAGNLLASELKYAM